MTSNTKKSTTKAQTAAKPRVAALHLDNDVIRASKEFASIGGAQAKKAQETFQDYSRESMEKWSEYSGKTVQAVNEIIASAKDQVEAIVESSKIATEMSKEMQEALVEEMNEMFAENIAISKDFLACRTMSDFMDLSNRAIQNNIARMFDQTAQLSEICFKLATEASEPISAQANQFSARLSKTLAA